MNSRAIRPRSDAERSLGVTECIVDMTKCNVRFTVRTGEAKRPGRMHRRSNAGGILSTGCKGEPMRNSAWSPTGGPGGYIGRLALFAVAVAGAACASGGSRVAMTGAEA